MLDGGGPAGVCLQRTRKGDAMTTTTNGSLRSITGSLDADSHEMIPMHMWADAFGDETAALFMPLAKGLISRAGANSTKRDDIVGDVMAIDYDSVWRHKGPDAPSAIDL